MSRYDLSEFEWQVVAPLLPNKQRGVARVDDRRVLNGIFWVLRSGSPWRDLRERYRAIHDLLQSVPALGKGGGVGSDYGCDYRCLWRRCADDRRHERACSSFSCDFKKSHLERCLGRSRGGLTAEIHALTDGEGLPVKFVITPGNTHDTQAATELLADIQPGQMVLGDKAYDANWLKNYVSDRSGWADIPPRTLRKSPICFSPWLYKTRNLVEHFFNKLRYFRRIVTRYDKLGSTLVAMVKLACIHFRLRHYESTA